MGGTDQHSGEPLGPLQKLLEARPFGLEGGRENAFRIDAQRLKAPGPRLGEIHASLSLPMAAIHYNEYELPVY
jgi:hypothetical protein